MSDTPSATLVSAIPGSPEPGEPAQSVATESWDAPQDEPIAVVEPVRVAPVNPKTGEPRRPGTIWVSAGAEAAAVGCFGVSLGMVYWTAVENFPEASWLMANVPAEIASLTQVLLAVAVTGAALIGSIAAVIAGFYAWAGYRWTRVAALIAWVLSGLALLLNVVAWPAIALTALAAVLLWLPPSTAFFTAWRRRRHPERVYAEAVTDVYYGPLPRYR